MTTTSTDTTRSKFRAALAPEVGAGEPRSTTRAGSLEARAPQLRAAGFSVIDCVREGVDAWWQRSAVGRATQAATPLVEPYLKPLVRRHYQAVLLGSVAAGALVSRFPGRSTRTVLKIAGPVLVTSVMFEVAKAGLRHLKRRA